MEFLDPLIVSMVGPLTAKEGIPLSQPEKQVAGDSAENAGQHIPSSQAVKQVAGLSEGTDIRNNPQLAAADTKGQRTP